MYEFSLYGQVPQGDHARVVQQLVGVTRMKPQSVQRLHLVFRSQVPAGIPNIPSSFEGPGKQDVQRIAKMLTSSLYVVQVIGEIQDDDGDDDGDDVDDVDMVDGEPGKKPKGSISWCFEFKDTPDPGKQQPVSGRLMSRTPIEDGDIVTFMKSFGYDYVNRFVVRGDRFYDQDTTLFLYRLYKAPDAREGEVDDWSFMTGVGNANLFDISGAYILQASIDAVDGSTAELKDRATGQLLRTQDTLKQAVTLTPGDRLALATTVPVRR